MTEISTEVTRLRYPTKTEHLPAARIKNNEQYRFHRY